MFGQFAILEADMAVNRSFDELCGCVTLLPSRRTRARLL